MESAFLRFLVSISPLTQLGRRPKARIPSEHFKSKFQKENRCKNIKQNEKTYTKQNGKKTTTSAATTTTTTTTTATIKALLIFTTELPNQSLIALNGFEFLCLTTKKGKQNDSRI